MAAVVLEGGTVERVPEGESTGTPFDHRVDQPGLLQGAGPGPTLGPTPSAPWALGHMRHDAFLGRSLPVAHRLHTPREGLDAAFPPCMNRLEVPGTAVNGTPSDGLMSTRWHLLPVGGTHEVLASFTAKHGDTGLRSSPARVEVSIPGPVNQSTGPASRRTSRVASSWEQRTTHPPSLSACRAPCLPSCWWLEPSSLAPGRPAR